MNVMQPLYDAVSKLVKDEIALGVTLFIGMSKSFSACTFHANLVAPGPSV